MGFFRNRQVALTLALVLLAAVLAGALGVRLALRLVAMGALAMLGYHLVGWLIASVRRGRLPGPGARRAVELSLQPPPERYRGRAPTTLEELLRALDAARLGKVERRPHGALLEGEGGELFELQVHDPSRVVLSELSVRATSAELAVLACDALAPQVGPMTVAVEGVELFVDGTAPRAALERELFDRRMYRAKEVEAAQKAAPRDRRYLN